MAVRLSTYLTLIALLLAGVSSAHAEEETSKRTITVSLDAPATNYSVKITHVYQAKEKLLVVAQIHKRGQFGGAAITRIKDSIQIEAPDLKIETYVLNKTWNWKGKEPYIYVSKAQLEKVLEETSPKLIWSTGKDKDKKTDKSD